MKTVGLQIFDVFTTTAFGGNIAGVVSEAGDLSDRQMQIIAREIGVPATGFLFGSDEANFAVRFFSPVQEMGMCGHGLIALCTRLVAEGRITGGPERPTDISIATGSGIVAVLCLLDDGAPRFMMKQAPHALRPSDVDAGKLARALGVTPEQFMPNLPIEHASGALEHLIVPVRDLETLAGMTPDFSALTAISHALGVISIDVFTTQTVGPDAAVHSRDFCPVAGIPEAAGSGTTNSALCCYMISHDLLSPDAGGMVRFSAEQGYEMGRKSEILCEARVQDGIIRELSIGGAAVMSVDGRIFVPEMPGEA